MFPLQTLELLLQDNQKRANVGTNQDYDNFNNKNDYVI